MANTVKSEPCSGFEAVLVMIKIFYSMYLFFFYGSDRVEIRVRVRSQRVNSISCMISCTDIALSIAVTKARQSS